MKLAIVGATGMVGKVMLKVLEERNFNITEIFLVASDDSIGKKLFYLEKATQIISLNELLLKKPDMALFSAGAETSRIWAPKLAELGCKVIDNSSYWRMCSKHKLIVPEINGDCLKEEDLIIANPNCSTIPLVMILSPIHEKFIVKRVVVSTYQSVTGTGVKGLNQLINEEKSIKGDKIYPHQIYQNVLPHCDSFEENNYTKEEMKLINETKKILDKNIEVTSTAVRVPTIGGHCSSVNITLEKEFSLDQVYSILKSKEGVKILDDKLKNEYPMPINVQNQDEVFVGRIRKDFSLAKTLNLWVACDNLRKGAATNAIQIAEYLVANKLL